MTDYEDKKEHNGWTNYKTWCVVSNLDNVYELYVKVQAWKEAVKKHIFSKNYTSLLRYIGMSNKKTLEGVAYNDKAVNGNEIVQSLFLED